MGKQRSVNLPSSQGGLIGGVSSNYKSKVEFSPKFVIVFAFIIVFFVFILFLIT
jgi:hypothetical protein